MSVDRHTWKRPRTSAAVDVAQHIRGAAVGMLVANRSLIAITSISATTGYKYRWIEGYSIDKLLGEAIHFSPDELGAIGDDLLSALVELERSGVSHVDVASPNSVVDRQGRTSLIDYDSSAFGPQLVTQIHARPDHAAPELLELGLVTPKADVYACGKMISELNRAMALDVTAWAADATRHNLTERPDASTARRRLRAQFGSKQRRGRRTLAARIRLRECPTKFARSTRAQLSALGRRRTSTRSFSVGLLLMGMACAFIDHPTIAVVVALTGTFFLGEGLGELL